MHFIQARMCVRPLRYLWRFGVAVAVSLLLFLHPHSNCAIDHLEPFDVSVKHFVCVYNSLSLSPYVYMKTWQGVSVTTIHDSYPFNLKIINLFNSRFIQYPPFYMLRYRTLYHFMCVFLVISHVCNCNCSASMKTEYTDRENRRSRNISNGLGVRSLDEEEKH